MSLIASRHGQQCCVVERQDLPLSGLAAFARSYIISGCFDISRSRQHGIASKQAQLPKTNLSNGRSAMLVGCGYKDELKYRYHKRASG